MTAKKIFQIGFALHQVKRGPEFRSLIVAPDGYDLLEFDAAGQEFRWMAVASGDATMLRMCQPGEDAHAYLGARVKGLDYRDVQRRHEAGGDEEISGPQGVRNFGKLGNLSCQYRTSAKKLRIVARVDYDIPLSENEAYYLWRIYRETYPDVVNYWRDAIERCKRQGYAETFAGRRVYVQGNWSGKDGWAMESTAINDPIQGTGADQKYLALSVLSPYLLRHKIIYALDLHDGLYFYVPSELRETAPRDMKFLLDNLPYQKAWGFTPPIPMPWDCKIGSSWGALKSVKL